MCGQLGRNPMRDVFDLRQVFEDQLVTARFRTHNRFIGSHLARSFLHGITSFGQGIGIADVPAGCSTVSSA